LFNCKPKLEESHGNSMWMLKPIDLNRGRGIEIFDSLDWLKQYLANSNSKSFVIQKYIEKPLLVEGRKFDIRVWMLIDHEMNCYFFKEGYVRTSSVDYDPGALQNRFIHLTNNAIQKYGSNYGEFEDGN